MDAENNTIKEQDIFNEFGDLPEEGDTWYLISMKWLNKWKSFAGIDKYNSSDESPGPIDNSGLFEDNLKTLLGHLVEDVEYQLVPEGAWKKLLKLYGIAEGQEPIARKAILSGTYTKQVQVEIFPPVICMKQHDSDGQIVKEPFSRNTLISVVHKRMRDLFEIPKNVETRIYIEDSVDHIEDSDTMDKHGIGPTTTLVLERQNDGGTWPRSTISPPSYKEATSSTSSSSSSTSKYNKYSSSSSYNSNSYNGSSGYGTRSTSFWSSSREEKPGLCGLSNLGNTCFMSSAIQCLSNVPPLTMYFEDKKYKSELNRNNPLGMRGKLAEAYAQLIHDMWSGANSSVAPREFKYNVSSFAPQFSGYQQHDSQELLAFLIDGLHEDLNRITKKPYIELKDSGGRPDPVVAKEAWMNHLQRNDSVIVDMFHGLFKSTIVCPDCDRISVTFDPFGFVSLPLPRAKEMPIICNFVPRDPNKSVSRHNIHLPKDGNMKDLCKALAQRVGCKAKHLVVTDVYNHRFYKVYRGSERLSSYSDRDNLFVFQLGFEEDEDSDDSDIEYAKVYMRQGAGGNMAMRLFAHPFLIPVKPGKTKYRKFYNSVLAAVSRYVKQEFRDNVKMLSELKKVELNESMGSDVDGNENGDSAKEEQLENEEEETHWFNIVQINSFGTTIMKELADGDKPIKCSSDVYYSAEWNTKVCEEYSVEDWSKTFELDPSMSEQPKKEGISLQQCMKLFTTKEQLGEHDLWYCPSCKDHKQATKKFDLWNLPPYLIIHLKRFSYTRWSRDKISTYVDFPTRGLDLSEFIINPTKSEWEPSKKKYNLIGVSNHYGGMGGGHYTAYCRNWKENKWYYFDDTSVSESSEDRVKTKAAYMLMYQRQDMEEWLKNGGKGKLNFLESMVSPRSCNEEFAFDENTKAIQKRERFQNGGDNQMDGLSNGTPMETD